MQEPAPLDEYPARIVAVSTLLSLSICGIGSYLVFLLSPALSFLYIIAVILLELRLISRHCTDCYYYNRTCAFGKGRIAILFPRGSPARFCAMTITWKDLLPDFCTFLVPALLGVALLVMEFRITVLALVIALVLLGFLGNAFVRGRLACRYCRQRELGCPALQMFEKKNT